MSVILVHRVRERPVQSTRARKGRHHRRSVSAMVHNIQTRQSMGDSPDPDISRQPVPGTLLVAYYVFMFYVFMFYVFMYT